MEQDEWPEITVHFQGSYESTQVSRIRAQGLQNV
jgi:hypothetical protein